MKKKLAVALIGVAALAGTASTGGAWDDMCGTHENPVPCDVPPPVPPAPAPPVVDQPTPTEGTQPPPAPVAPAPPTPTPPRTTTPPRRAREFCENPAKLRIFQQQRGTFYTQIYPLRVTIRNTTGNVTPRGALILEDQGLQNFVGPNGDRVDRLVVPVGPMHKGQLRVVNRMMGFVGFQALNRVFTTYATFVVKGRVCGYTQDRAFEG